MYKNISTSCSKIWLLASLLIISSAPLACQASAKLIKVPLQRAITQGVGQLGQPVVNYYTVVQIGSPSVSFKVQFDVGLSEHFVPHYTWNPFNRNLHYSTGFQCKVSSTCSKTDVQYTFSYQSCKLTGKRYEDIMSLVAVHTNSSQDNTVRQGVSTPKPTISPAGATWRQSFLAVSSASDGRFSSLPIDGFFGLSPALQSASSIANLLVSLHQAQLVDNLQFSIWFNPVLDSTDGGELVLGGVDPSLYQGQIYWHNLAGPTMNQWQVGLQQVMLGNQVVSCWNKQCQAVLSTGSSDIVGPRDDVAHIYSLLNTTRSSSGLELIDCRRISSLPYITFYIDGIPYYLLPSNYIRKTVEGRIFMKETCYVAILADSSSETRTWTLTTPFLGAYYTVFDLTHRQLGFATLK